MFKFGNQLGKNNAIESTTKINASINRKINNKLAGYCYGCYAPTCNAE